MKRKHLFCAENGIAKQLTTACWFLLLRIVKGFIFCSKTKLVIVTACTLDPVCILCQHCCLLLKQAMWLLDSIIKGFCATKVQTRRRILVFRRLLNFIDTDATAEQRRRHRSEKITFSPFVFHLQPFTSIYNHLPEM